MWNPCASRLRRFAAGRGSRTILALRRYNSKADRAWESRCDPIRIGAGGSFRALRKPHCSAQTRSAAFVSRTRLFSSRSGHRLGGGQRSMSLRMVRANSGMPEDSSRSSSSLMVRGGCRFEATNSIMALTAFSGWFSAKETRNVSGWRAAKPIWQAVLPGNP